MQEQQQAGLQPRTEAYKNICYATIVQPATVRFGNGLLVLGDGLLVLGNGLLVVGNGLCSHRNGLLVHNNGGFCTSERRAHAW